MVDGSAPEGSMPTPPTGETKPNRSLWDAVKEGKTYKDLPKGSGETQKSSLWKLVIDRVKRSQDAKKIQEVRQDLSEEADTPHQGSDVLHDMLKKRGESLWKRLPGYGKTEEPQSPPDPLNKETKTAA